MLVTRFYLWTARSYRDDPTDPPPHTDPNKPVANGNNRTFTQEELNNIIARELGPYKEREQKIKQRLDELTSQNVSTEEEKKAYRQKLSEMETIMLTKEQQAQREQEKVKAEADQKQKRLEEEASTWKSRFTQREIVHAIVEAATAHGGYKPRQFVPFLEGKARLEERVDSEGLPTGEFDVKIRWDGVDKDGRPAKMDLSPHDTVKAMKGNEEYANFFLSEAGGTGYVPTRGSKSSGPVDVSKMSTEDYANRGGREAYLRGRQSK